MSIAHTDHVVRLDQLEDEIRRLRRALAPEPRTFRTRLSDLLKAAVANWVLISFLAALAIAVYVKLQWGVDYFEEYRNIATTRNLADFYRQLGDRLMAYSEWKAAEDAYRAAVAINPRDLKASYGIVKAQVFQPLDGQKVYAAEIVDAKLAYLESRFPDDHEIYFLKSVRYLDQGDVAEAKKWTQRSLDLKPDFVGGHLQMGYLHQNSFEIGDAIKSFTRALELDPNYAMANNNLGFAYIIQAQFDKAIEHLKKSYTVSPTLLTALNLGDAYRFAGDIASAVFWHQHALDVLNDPKAPVNDGFVSGEWTYNFMPLQRGDVETIKRYVNVFTQPQKRAFAHYALSFDKALAEEFDAADRELRAARELDPDGRYRVFFANRVAAIASFVQLKPKAREWLVNVHTDLLRPRSVPARRP